MPATASPFGNDVRPVLLGPAKLASEQKEGGPYFFSGPERVAHPSFFAIELVQLGSQPSWITTRE